MLGLIGAMLRARRVQNTILTALVTLTVAAAVALPMFIAAAKNAMISDEINAAPNAQRMVSSLWGVKLGHGASEPTTFPLAAAVALALPGFEENYNVQADAAVLTASPSYPVLEYFQDECDHITMLSGRCPVGSSEVVIDSALAARQHLALGSTVPLEWAYYDPQNGWTADRTYSIKTVSVVGIYRPNDADEPYWGLTQQFLVSTERSVDAPVLGGLGIVSSFDRGGEVQGATAVISKAALTSASSRSDAELDGLVRQIEARMVPLDKIGAIDGTQIPQLVAQIEKDRRMLRVVPALVGLPLIGMGAFAVYLAGSYAVGRRREELGVVSLRGARFGARWSIGIGESLLSVLIGIPCGIVLALVTMWLTARFLMPGRPATGLSASGVPVWTGAAAGLCVLAVVLSAYSTLRTPTLDLLRDVPRRARAWWSAAIEVIVVALAAVAVGQLRLDPGHLTGIELIAPGLLVVALAVVVARLVTPLAAFIGARGLRRARGGRRLGRAVGALQVARRSGASRVFVVLVSAIGLLTFLTFDIAVENTAVAARAGAEVGAARVADVLAATRQDLLAKVAAADPGGRWAMAVVSVPQPTASEPPILALDTTRLATVATWPRNAPMSAAEAARVLRPPAADPVVFTASAVSLTATLSWPAGASAVPPRLSLGVQPYGGAAAQALRFSDPMRPGTHTYSLRTPQCAAGCRVVGVTVTDAYAVSAIVSLASLDVVTPAPMRISVFDTPGQWRSLLGADDGFAIGPSQAGPDGLTIVTRPGVSGFEVSVQVADATYPVPALATAPLGHPLQGAITAGAAPRAIPMVLVGRSPVLPRVSSRGIIVDLTTLDRALPSIGDQPVDPQVWLSADAPADAPARLRRAGLTVTAVHDVAGVEHYYDGLPVALTTRLAAVMIGGLALLVIGIVVLIAAADRTRRADELRALRIQGMSRRGVRSAARFAYGGLLGAAAVGGLLAGAATWWITRAAIPLFVDSTPIVVPMWPGEGVLAVLAAGVAVLTLVTAAAAARDQSGQVRRRPDRPRRRGGGNRGGSGTSPTGAQRVRAGSNGGAERMTVGRSR